MEPNLRLYLEFVCFSRSSPPSQVWAVITFHLEAPSDTYLFALWLSSDEPFSPVYTIS